MVDEAFHEHDSRAYAEIQEQLHQQEQRLLARLQEAQVEQASALERFHHAEARLLKRIARTQRIEARLATLRQQIVLFSTSDSASLRAEFLGARQAQGQDMVTSINENDPLRKAQAARAVAEATEEAARLAIERAHTVASQLAHMATGRHLMQELLTLEEDAAHASVAALDAELAAQEAEQLASAEPLPIAVTFERENNENTGRVEAITAQGEDIDASTRGSEDRDEIATSGESGDAQGKDMGEAEETATNTHMGPPSALERERVAEIDEEEEMVEMVTAMMIADVTAANAAKAEAFAEEASARTREARRLVKEIDAVLDRIREAIRSGNSTGDAADAILFDAERDATRAHAMLADAESAEERARRAAMEAEAEAEVAEGMAFATEDRNESAEVQCDGEVEAPPLALIAGQQHTGDTGEMERLAQHTMTEKSLEDEDTIEIPVVHPHSF